MNKGMLKINKGAPVIVARTEPIMTEKQRKELSERIRVASLGEKSEGRFTEDHATKVGDYLTLLLLESIENADDPWDVHYLLKAYIGELERVAFHAAEYGEEWDMLDEEEKA